MSNCAGDDLLHGIKDSAVTPAPADAARVDKAGGKVAIVEHDLPISDQQRKLSTPQVPHVGSRSRNVGVRAKAATFSGRAVVKSSANVNAPATFVCDQGCLQHIDNKNILGKWY